MKILCIIDSFNVGGAQRQFTFLVKSLSQHHDVQVLVYYPFTSFLEDEINELNIPVTKIIKNSRYDIRLVYRILKFIKGNKFDCSISFLDTPNFYNELAKLAGVIPKIIVSQRSAYFKNDITLRKRIVEYFHVFADVVVTNSFSQKERMESYFPFLKKKLFYIPNGYSFKKEMGRFKRRNGLFKFVVLSNTHHYKNPLILCKAIVRYKELYGTVNFEIDWFGRVSQRLNDLTPLNEGLAILKSHNLEEILEFKGITHRPFEKILGADALLHLSNFEGCPNSVCEAMFLRKPILLSNVCDHPYLISNNGYLFDQKDPDSIAKRIFEMVNNSESDLKQMGENSRIFIESKMGSDYVSEKWKNLIEKRIKCF